MPIIRVEMFAGRSAEQKRTLVAGLTEAFVSAAGGNAQAVQVVITEVEKTDWGMGGKSAADLYPD